MWVDVVADKDYFCYVIWKEIDFKIFFVLSKFISFVLSEMTLS